MINNEIVLTLFIFMATILFIVWRPKGMNEAIPSTIGAAIIFITGIVSLDDVYHITGIVSGASLTIFSTIVMSIVLESIGFFRWAAYNLLIRAKGSGIRLFWYINFLCFTMTMFINNDGSTIIMTPIIIQIVNLLNLKPHQKFPYLLSGVLIANAASAPIGVSNLANLIALNIVGLDLNAYLVIMVVPSMIGVAVISLLLFLYFKKEIPNKISTHNIDPFVFRDWKNGYKHHPLDQPLKQEPIDWWMFRVCLIVVVAVRISYFTLSSWGIPIEWIAVAGAGLLILIRWSRKKIAPVDVFQKAPWHIFIFAFNMYVLVYAFKNTGLISRLSEVLQGPISGSLFNASLMMGLFTTIMSLMFNNLPSVMTGTVLLVGMDLKDHILQVGYLANVLGSDLGSLLSPMGTLSTLIWMFILRKNGIPMTWGKYIRVVVLIIPIALLLSLLSLYLWTRWFIF